LVGPPSPAFACGSGRSVPPKPRAAREVGGTSRGARGAAGGRRRRARRLLEREGSTEGHGVQLLEEARAVRRQLLRSYSADLQPLTLIARTPLRHLEQRRVTEDHICRYALLRCQLATQGLESIEERAVEVFAPETSGVKIWLIFSSETMPTPNKTSSYSIEGGLAGATAATQRIIGAR